MVAGGANVIEIGNVFVGNDASEMNTSSNNTFIGSSAGKGNTTEQGNTYLGKNAAVANNDGRFNVAISWSVHIYTGLENTVVIGSTADVNAINKVRLGNTSIAVIESQVDWTFPSDARLKYNVEENGIPGMEFISRLRPMTYQFDRKKFESHLIQNLPDSAQQERRNIMEAIKAPEPIQTGFLAQEVEQICKDLDYNFSGLHVPESDVDNYGIAYGSFVPLLVKAMQEQQEEIDSLKISVQLLLNELQEIKAEK